METPWWTYRFYLQFSVVHILVLWLPKCIYTQGRNQEFFRAGEFSRNQGRSINISSTTHERKAPQGKNMAFFLVKTLKTTFKMRNLTQDGHNQGIFFSKIRALFSNIWKRAREASPCPPLVTCLIHLGLTYKILMIWIYAFPGAVEFTNPELFLLNKRNLIFACT